MNKAEQFIKDYTRGCSNETTPIGSFDHTYHEWLTPEQALAAVEIAREELVEKACEFLDGCIPDYIDLKHANVDTFMDVYNERFIKDFKNYMKGE